MCVAMLKMCENCKQFGTDGVFIKHVITVSAVNQNVVYELDILTQLLL